MSKKTLRYFERKFDQLKTNINIKKFLRINFLNNGVRTIARKENCPRVRVRVGVSVRIRLRVEGNFPRGQLS